MLVKVVRVVLLILVFVELELLDLEVEESDNFVVVLAKVVRVVLLILVFVELEVEGNDNFVVELLVVDENCGRVEDIVE